MPRTAISVNRLSRLPGGRILASSELEGPSGIDVYLADGV
jgi:hypothetical protein